VSLQRLLDAEHLRGLIGDYLVAADRGRSADLAALFAPDGVLEIRGEGPDAGVHVGPDAILARLEANRAELAQLMDGPLLRHHVSSIRIDLDDESAPRGWSYFLAVTASGPDHWGRYADRYRRVDGTWRFAHRVVHLEGWAPDSWMARSRTATAGSGS
jgi:hypothetical protein